MEDKAKEQLKGSPSRDTFKQKHKLLAPNSFYACDLDLVLIAKTPTDRIAAFLDYKRAFDIVTFSEVVAYNQLAYTAPIYIVKGNDPATGPFVVYSYKRGDPRPNPPAVELIKVAACRSWADLVEWEQNIREGKANE